MTALQDNAITPDVMAAYANFCYGFYTYDVWDTFGNPEQDADARKAYIKELKDNIKDERVRHIVIEELYDVLDNSEAGFFPLNWTFTPDEF
jgi:hypothetical protein